MTSIDNALQDAAAHSQLGLPIPKTARSRTLKRLVIRLCWPFLHHQVALNQDLLEALNSIRVTISQLQSGIDALSEARQRVQNIDTELFGLRNDLSHISSVVERQDVALMRHEELAIRADKRFDRIDDETDLVSLKMDLAQTQIISRVQDSIADLQTRLDGILNEFHNSPTSSDGQSGTR